MTNGAHPPKKNGAESKSTKPQAKPQQAKKGGNGK